jgi:hypothetical protein
MKQMFMRHSSSCGHRAAVQRGLVLLVMVSVIAGAGALGGLLARLTLPGPAVGAAQAGRR